MTLSFNLRRGRGAGRRGRRPSQAAERQAAAARRRSAASFQGTAQAFQASLANQPLLILAALVAVYIVLGVLYESLIHPITILSTLPSAGVGAILALMLCRMDLNIIGDDRPHPPHRHRQEERDHDDRLRASTPSARRGDGAGDAIYEACLLRFRPIMMTTMAALLGALAARARHRARLRAAPARSASPSWAG